MDTPTILGIIGLIIISMAIWVKIEKKQDILFVIGGVLLFVYSISIENVIFSVLQAVFILSALVELVRMKGTR
mgnify:CR=1 FL=1